MVEIAVKIVSMKTVGRRRDGSDIGHVAIEVTAPMTDAIAQAVYGARSAVLTLNDHDRWAEIWRCKCGHIVATNEMCVPNERGMCPDCGTPMRWAKDVEVE